jgi:outer membrane protein assembly factor BamB
VADPKTPTSFDAKKDLAWKAKLPGVGHGSPIVVGDKVFLQAAAADGGTRSLVCLSAKTGDQVWAKSLDAKSAPTHKKNNLAASTPCSDGERVYTTVWDGTGVSLLAYDLNGERVWEKGLGSYASQHGYGNSPVAVGGLVVVNFDQDGAAELVAHDAKTGEQKWKAERKAHRATYTTPFVIEKDGKPAELVVASTTTVDGYDPATGKVNWTFTVPWPTERKFRAIGQPVLAAGNVVLATGDGDGSRTMLAVKGGGRGDVSKDGPVWRLTKGTPYVPGVLVKGDYLYWVGDDGIAGCADAKTGKVQWTDRVLSEAVSASPLLVGDTVFVIGEAGTAAAFKADPKEPAEVTKSEVGEPVFATPAAVGGKLFVRGSTHLFCFSKK